MIVRFRQRNFLIEQVLPAGLTVEVQSYEKHAHGGCQACELEVSGDSSDLMELLDWLRCRIEIFDDKGVPLWWGIVSRVEVPVGKVLLVSDLESMANAIKVVYTINNANGESTGISQETDWVIDEESIEKYGRKELLLSIGDSNAVAADTRARIELTERAFPRIFAESETQSDVARVEGVGEWSTLGWRYADVPTKLALAFQTSGAGGFDLAAPEIKVAQSFRTSSDFQLSDIAVYLRKVGSPGDLTLEVLDFVAENMPGDALTSVTVPAELVGASYSWVIGKLSEVLPMATGKRYFLAISSQWCDLSNYYAINLDENHGYPEGTFRINVSEGWQADSRDVPFVINENKLSLSYSSGSESGVTIDNTTTGVAQQITTSAPTRFAEAGIKIRRIGDPGRLELTLHEDNADTPGDKITSATIDALEVGTSTNWVRGLFEQAVSKPAGKYWLSAKASQADSQNCYVIQYDPSAGYAGGAMLSLGVGDFIDGAADMPFRTRHNAVLSSYSTMDHGTIRMDNTQKSIAQTFTLANSANITRARVFVKKFGTPGDLIVTIAEVNEIGEPAGRSLMSGQIDASDIGETGDWVTVEFLGAAPVTGMKQYALVLGANGISNANGYDFQVDSTGAYPGQAAWTKDSNNVWSRKTSDLPFAVIGAVDGLAWGDGSDAARQINKTNRAVAQQIRADVNSEMVWLSFQARKVGIPGDLSVGFYSNAHGWPGELLGSFVVNRGTIGADWGWISGWLNKQCPINSGGYYWIKVSAEGVDDNNYYEIGVNSGAGYAPGVMYLELAGQWGYRPWDMFFQLYEPQAAHQHTAGAASGTLGKQLPMIAQQVVMPAQATMASVALKLAKVGQPGDVSVDVCAFENGYPGEVLGSAKISADEIGASAGFVTGALEKPVALEAGGDGCFLVISASRTSEISYYNLTIDADGGYAPGYALVKEGDVWAEGPGDMPFRLYSNDFVETSQQIQSLLTAYGQLFRAIFVDVESGVYLESYRGGETDALEEIEKMLEGGNIDNLRMLARVNYDRTVEVWLAPIEGLDTAVEMRSDGKLWYRTGSEVEPSFDPTGKWVSLEPILRSARFTNVITGSQQNFIDAASWDKNGLVSTQPAGWENNLSRKLRLSDG